MSLGGSAIYMILYQTRRSSPRSHTALRLPVRSPCGCPWNVVIIAIGQEFFIDPAIPAREPHKA
jgi:hypothetical protein